jgi:hypothetical protein
MVAIYFDATAGILLLATAFVFISLLVMFAWWVTREK